MRNVVVTHAEAEQCQPGDVLVVTTTSACTDGAFGELLATSLQRRGVEYLDLHAFAEVQ